MSRKQSFIIPLFDNKWKVLRKLTNEQLGDILHNVIEYAISKKDGAPIEEPAFTNELLEGYYVMLITDYDCLDVKKENDRERLKEYRAKKSGEEIVRNCTELYGNVRNCNDTILNSTQLNSTQLNSTQLDSTYNNKSGKPDIVESAESKKDKYSDEINEVVQYLNEKTDKHYSAKADSTRKHIRARLEEGYTVEDCKKAIDNKVMQWKGNDMDKYLRPSTLFNSEKFEGYANETVTEPKTSLQKDYEKISEWVKGGIV